MGRLDCTHYVKGDIVVRRSEDLYAVMIKLLWISVAAILFASSATYGRSLDVEELEHLMEFRDAMEVMMKRDVVHIMKCYKKAVVTTRHVIDLNKLAINKADAFLAVKKPSKANMKEWATHMHLYYKSLKEKLLKNPALTGCNQYYKKHLPIATQKKMTADMFKMWEHTRAMKLETLTCPALAHKVTNGLKALNEKYFPFAERFVNHLPSRKAMDEWVIRFGPYWNMLHWKHPAIE